MKFSELIDSRLELLKIAINTKDENWASELKDMLERIVTAEKFVELKKKEYEI